MSREKQQSEAVLCPVGRFFADLEKCRARKPEFTRHMNRSRVEFLKAIRSLIDERIACYEEKDGPTRKKAAKIKVE